VVTDKLAEQHLKRTSHPAYGRDLSHCDFFLFGYPKNQLTDKQYATPEELFAEVAMIISEIPSDLTSRVFATWQERLQNAVICEGTTLSKYCISADLRSDEPNASLRFRLTIEHPAIERRCFQ
jgi:hypothetical protein